MAPLEADGSLGAIGLAVVGVFTMVLGVMAQAFIKLTTANSVINFMDKVSFTGKKRF